MLRVEWRDPSEHLAHVFQRGAHDPREDVNCGNILRSEAFVRAIRNSKSPNIFDVPRRTLGILRGIAGGDSILVEANVRCSAYFTPKHAAR